MRLGEGVEWALHCVALLAALPEGVALPAGRLAEFHGVPAAYLAKTMQALSQAGIVEATPGRRGGYRLARPATGITLLDVVEAVEGREPSFRCTEIRRRGPSRVDDQLYPPVCAIAGAMHRADRAWRRELSRTTIADLVQQASTNVPAAAAAKAAAWLEEVLR